MTAAKCACGFTEDEAADETIGDHLFEAFAPQDGRAADGRVHLEGEAALFCMCGAGGSADELDAHFLAVFTPADLIGADRRKHEKTASSNTGAFPGKQAGHERGDR
jgi:hypothetical protein